MLRERNLLADKFFSITEQKMLQLTLPLFEPNGQKVATMKTIQLFILTVKDFRIAVDYLSTNAGMRHCQINEVLQDLRGPNFSRPTPVSRPRHSTGMSLMRPPTAPLMERPMRPQSQTSVHPIVKYSPLEPVYRPQTARPSLTRGPGISSQSPSTPGPFVPVSRRPSSREHGYSSNPMLGPPGRRSSFVPGDFSYRRPMLSMDTDGGDLGDRRSLYDHQAHLDSINSHSPPDPLRPSDWRPLPSSTETIADFGEVPDGRYHHRFSGQPPSSSGQTFPSARRTINTTTYPLERRLLPRPLASRATSRSSTLSDRGVPIRIQVIDPLDEPNHALWSINPKIRWEFTLHLLPTTKIWELCLHAAGYISREYHATVDGNTLAAQSTEGTPFKHEDSLSDEVLQGQTIRLIEGGPSSMAQSLSANLRRSSLKPLHSGLRSEASRLDGGRHASPPNPFPHGIDDDDCVPPPRQLPFRVATTPAPLRSPTSNPAARPPLSERTDLMNANPRSHPDQTSAQPASQETGKRAVASKQSNNSQRHLIAIPRRRASSATGSKLDSATVTAIASESRTSGKRSETSLGTRRKRKAPSSDTGVSAAVLPIVHKSGANDLSTRSCMGCRNKKRKCDRSKPACGPCRKDKRPCTYPNIPVEAVPSHSPEKPREKPGLDTDSHPMILRGQAPEFAPISSDASAQTNHATMFRDIGTQSEAIVHVKQDAEMKDVGTDPSNVYTHACTETDMCDDLWVPFSRCAQLVLWANDQYKRTVQQAADILRTTDPSQDDYKDKLTQAAVYAGEFMDEFRDKYAQALES